MKRILAILVFLSFFLTVSGTVYNNLFELEYTAAEQCMVQPTCSVVHSSDFDTLPKSFCVMLLKNLL